MVERVKHFYPMMQGKTLSSEKNQQKECVQLLAATCLKAGIVAMSKHRQVSCYFICMEIVPADCWIAEAIICNRTLN